ncbi:MAG: hypothetical protein ACRELW_12510 [Candidatus Rokuibacteriota bacterium]
MSAEVVSARVPGWGRAWVGQGSARVWEPVRVSGLVEVWGLGPGSAQVQALEMVGASGQVQGSERAWEPVVERPATEVRALLEPARPQGRPEPQRPVRARANRSATIG